MFVLLCLSCVYVFGRRVAAAVGCLRLVHCAHHIVAGVVPMRFCFLGRHKVVAIDTEHHSYESYKGFICLIQLSTCGSAGAAKDFLVDPFSLFVHLTALNELTANPKILKILHGSASDVIWLQVHPAFHYFIKRVTQLAFKRCLRNFWLSLLHRSAPTILSNLSASAVERSSRDIVVA